jgi:hypothetical protein
VLFPPGGQRPRWICTKASGAAFITLVQLRRNRIDKGGSATAPVITPHVSHVLRQRLPTQHLVHQRRNTPMGRQTPITGQKAWFNPHAEWREPRAWGARGRLG